MLVYHQQVPPRIADRSIPKLGPEANRALRRAGESIGRLADATASSGINITPLLVGVLVRLEAISSSQIEDLDADLETELVRDHTDLGEMDTETALVRHNIAVVASAVTTAATVDIAWFCDLHRRLMTGSDLLPGHIGSFRDGPVWIGRTRASAEFEGPPHRLVGALMDDLSSFVARADVHPVVQAAIAHAQFETIHPFVDGNGRVGRALVHPILGKMAANVIVPASHALLARRSAYFAGLGSYRQGDLDGWTAEFARAVAVAADGAAIVTRELIALGERWQEQITTHRDGTTRAVLEGLPTNPVVTIASARALRKVSQPAALKAVTRLVDAGVLRPTVVKTPGKEAVWVAGGVIDALSSLERQFGRRPGL